MDRAFVRKIKKSTDHRTPSFLVIHTQQRRREEKRGEDIATMSCNDLNTSNNFLATPAAVTPTPHQGGTLREEKASIPSIETHAFQTYQPPCAAHQHSMAMNKPVEFVYNPDGTILVDNNNKRVTIDKILATKPLRHELSSRPGPGNRKLTYLSGEGVTRTLNDIFGYDGWNLDIKSTKREECMKDDKDRYHIAYTAHVRVTHRRTGAYKEDCGAGDAIDRSLGTAVANSLKASITDAMKRAARHFGDKLGNSLYSGSFNMNKAPTSLQQAIDQHEIQRANSKFGFPKDRPQATQTAPATNPVPATPAPNTVTKTSAIGVPAPNASVPSVAKPPLPAASTVQNPNSRQPVSSNSNTAAHANRPPVPQFHANGSATTSSNTAIPRPDPRPSAQQQSTNSNTETTNLNPNINNSRIQRTGQDNAAPSRKSANIPQPPLSAKQRLESSGLFDLSKFALGNRNPPPQTGKNVSTNFEINPSDGANSDHSEFASMFDSMPPRPGTSSGPQSGKRPANHNHEHQEPRKKQNPYLNQSSSM